MLIALAAGRSALATRARRAVAPNPAAPAEALALLTDKYYALDIPLTLAAHGTLVPEQRECMRANTLARAAACGAPLHHAVALTQPGAPAKMSALLTLDGNRFLRLSWLAPTNLRGLSLLDGGVSRWYPPELLPPAGPVGGDAGAARLRSFCSARWYGW